MTKAETLFSTLLQQIAHGLFDLANSVVISYTTGDVTVSIAGFGAAALQAARDRIAYVSLTVTVDNVAKTATVHAPALVTAINNMTQQNAIDIRNDLVYLGYTVTIDTTAKTVTLGWDNGSGG